MAKKLTNNGRKGGLLDGNSHLKGGINTVVGDEKRPVELEGGEIIITKPAVEDPKQHFYTGTNKEILSAINVSGGGVEIYKEGGLIDKNSLAALKKYFGGENSKEIYNNSELLFTHGKPRIIKELSEIFSDEMEEISNFLKINTRINLFIGTEINQNNYDTLYFIADKNFIPQKDNENDISLLSKSEAIDKINRLAIVKAKHEALQEFSILINKLNTENERVHDLLLQNEEIRTLIDPKGVTYAEFSTSYFKSGGVVCTSCLTNKDNYFKAITKYKKQVLRSQKFAEFSI